MIDIQTLMANPWVIAAILIWTTPWKIAAMWKAAQKKQFYWFIALFLINTLAILEILYIYVFSEKKKKR